jgi:hypothetical protein
LSAFAVLPVVEVAGSVAGWAIGGLLLALRCAGARGGPTGAPSPWAQA